MYVGRQGQKRLRLAAVFLIAGAFFVSGCEPLQEDELAREVETIRSLAGEGSVLADQIAAQNTKRTFARVQARELSDAAEHSSERLTDAHPAAGLGEEVQRAVGLADDVSAAIGRLEAAPDDASGAADASGRLRALSKSAEQLGGSL